MFLEECVGMAKKVKKLLVCDAVSIVNDIPLHCKIYMREKDL